jgi:hypothetical protein
MPEMSSRVSLTFARLSPKKSPTKQFLRLINIQYKQIITFHAIKLNESDALNDNSSVEFYMKVHFDFLKRSRSVFAPS